MKNTLLILLSPFGPVEDALEVNPDTGRMARVNKGEEDTDTNVHDVVGGQSKEHVGQESDGTCKQGKRR